MSQWLPYASSEVSINLLGIIVLMTSRLAIFEASFQPNKMSEHRTSAGDSRMYANKTKALRLLSIEDRHKFYVDDAGVSRSFRPSCR
jgi:hypothetical protein